MAKHTPRPWTFEEGSKFANDIRDASNRPIAAISHQTNFGQGEVRTRKSLIANGHLIAAAPDMLDALKVAESQMRISLDDRMNDRIREDRLAVVEMAITKAEGK